MAMRRLNAVRESKDPLKIVKELDAFPKIDDCYVETTARSGGVSLVMFAIIGVLIFSEIYSYTSYEVVYEYNVDQETAGELKINVDMTIAMPCAAIGADLLDTTGKLNIYHENNLKETNTVFEMDAAQKTFHELNRHKVYLREKYHSMHESIWDRGYSSDFSKYPERSQTDKTPKDACRFKGYLLSKKLSGNFHITLGKPVQMFGGGHAHLSVFGSTNTNFSHRVHHLSFGDDAGGRVNPLDGDNKITEFNHHIYQYYLKVVPTKVNTRYARADTYQFAVTERDRKLDHSAGSHGTPGIFFKYDFSPIKVYVEQKYKPFWKFLVRMCGIVGGIFACTGMVIKVFSTA